MTAGGLSVATALTAAACTSDGAEVAEATEQPLVGADPDLALLVAARDEEEALRGLVARTRKRHPGLREVLAATQAVHAVHVELLSGALDGDQQGDAPARPVPARPRQALAALRQAEQALAGSHTTTAMAARSGTFARLAAAMSAAAAQQDSALSQVPLPAPGGAPS